jgi:DNA-binding SARP family transcriptional activator
MMWGHRPRGRRDAIAPPRRRTRGCRLFVAAAGYGKTTALESAYAAGPVAYYTAEDVVAWLAGEPTDAINVDKSGTETAHVVVDGVNDLTAASLRLLARHLARLPDEVLVSLGSRRPLPPATLNGLPGRVMERDAADLALSPDVVARVLRDEHGIVDADAAYLVHDLTAGWPALVQFAGDAIVRGGTDRRALLDALTEPGTPAAMWMRERALADLPARPAALLDLAVDLDPVTVALCQEVAAVPTTPDGLSEACRWLVRTGFLVVHPRYPRGRPDEAYRVVPVLGDMLARDRSVARSRTRSDRLPAAATWYAVNGHPLAAMRALRLSGDPRRWLDFIETRSDEILAAGGATEVAKAIETIPVADRAPRIQLIFGDALRMAGNTSGALRAFEPLLAEAERIGRWPPALVWRAAMVHYMRSDYRAALELCDRPTSAHDSDSDAETAFFAACRASVLARLGASADAAAWATRALELAQAASDDRALAAAHIAVAFTSVGARRDEHLAEAQAAAERADDVVQLARVLTNQVVGLLRQARYGPALDAATRTVRVAELGSPPGMVAVALSNAGEALLRLGRYDEAALHFERTVVISRRAGLNRVAMGLTGLGEIDRLLGRREQGRAVLEEAVDLARAMADGQVLVPALARLTRLLLEGPNADMAAAREAADEAERVADPLLAPQAHVARGWVALAEGDLAAAQQRAAYAVDASRASRRADSLAESLELAAAVNPDSAAARAALEEAESIWRRAGALPAADQMLVLQGRLPGSDGARRSAARAATERLRSLGVRVVGGSTLLLADSSAAPVRIQVLGKFQVLVAGKPVPLTAWRSRQARSLLKILVARRGSPVARPELSGLLWPDDDAERTGHRLSVLLSIVRTALDPARLWPTDHHIRADVAGISLDIEHVGIDVEDLMRDAQHASELARSGQTERAREILAEVDTAYTGDAYSDEPYEDWAQGLREEARAVWLRALRSLADLSRRAGDFDQAVTSLVRLLAADAYDEPAHRSLVAVLVLAGRHGEARRAFDRWTQAMRSIDAPVPDPGVLRPAAVGGPR